MPTPVVPVTVTLAAQDGTPYVGVTVRARLDVNEVYEGIIISDQASAVTDAAGVAVLNCFPNAPSPTGLGTQGSTYRFWAAIPGGRSMNLDARVPNAACRLEDIIVNSQAVALDAAQMAIQQAQSHSASAGVSAASALASANAAAASAAAAAASEANADTSETNAWNSAASAATSATNAGNSATAAATSATNAGNSATAAATSATNASNSATTATTKAGEASTSATNAAASAAAAATSETNAAASAAAAGSAVENVRKAGQGGMGDDYVLGATVPYGSTAPNTSSYPATAQAFGTETVTTKRGFLAGASARLTAAGTGQLEIYQRDAHSPSGWFCLGTIPVSAVAAGVAAWNSGNTPGWYNKVIPVGSRVLYRWQTGGVMRYQTGGNDKYISTTALPVVGQAFNGSITDNPSGFDWAFAYDITEMDVQPLDERLDNVESGADARGTDLSILRGIDGITTTDVLHGNSGLAAAGTLTGGAFGWALRPTTKAGWLKNMILKTLNPSAKPAGSVETITFGIAKKQPDGTFKVNLFTLKPEVGLTQTHSNFKDSAGNPYFVPAGSVPFLTNLVAGQVEYSTDANGTAGMQFSGAVVEGGTVTFTDYQNSPLFQITLETVAVTQDQRNEATDKALRDSDDPVILARTLFPDTTAPVGYVVNGAWTFNDGAIPPAVGSWTTTIFDKDSSALSKRNSYRWVTINDTTAVVGLVASDALSVGGAAMVVDGTLNRIALYEYTAAGAATLRSFKALTFALVAGHQYLLYALKNRFSITYGIIDCTNTANSTNETFDGAGNYVMMHGRPGIVFVSGAGGANPVKFHKMQVDAPYKRKGHVLCAHIDSIGEAAYLGPSARGWPQLLADQPTNGVLTYTSLVGGAGGTNGTFALGITGGGGREAAGYFTVAGGSVVSIVFTARGRDYTSAPALSFAASGGLAGASATAVIAEYNLGDAKRVILAPRANDHSSLFISTKREENDFFEWLATYTIIAFGANETDFWRLNMNTIAAIAKAEARGSKPVLATLLPRTTIQTTVIDPYNAKVRNREFGDYDFIDFAKAVTLNNDGVTWDPAKAFDTAHPNAAGQLAMYAQLKADAPYLLTA